MSLYHTAVLMSVLVSKISYDCKTLSILGEAEPEKLSWKFVRLSDANIQTLQVKFVEVDLLLLRIVISFFFFKITEI